MSGRQRPSPRRMERISQLRSFLTDDPTWSVSLLAGAFGVSRSTIRRDLDYGWQELADAEVQIFYPRHGMQALR